MCTWTQQTVFYKLFTENMIARLKSCMQACFGRKQSFKVYLKDEEHTNTLNKLTIQGHTVLKS